MTKTKKDALTIEEALARLEAIDPATAVYRDRGAIAPIEDAVRARDDAERLVDEIVLRARRDGLTWIEIAAGLGVSPQAARKKYMDRV
ncbi:hypothetical protein [Pseudolysinimonas sp.]|uniref:hypothetical protein n=1 Tax=Pseudolysinimonas sp. TaxID=2680009 RepID=UPI00286A2CEB|nr:hypothetical protein [Pseudolysinimonas sp.]